MADVVYRLVRKGLNVYFDGSFDSHNASWIEQFPLNMASDKCKGIWVFLDNKYATSYATLLELMYSLTNNATDDEKGLPIVTVNLESLKSLGDKRMNRARNATPTVSISKYQPDCIHNPKRFFYHV